MPLRGQVAEDFLDRGQEPQIQHLVGLIQHHNLHLFQVQRTLVVQVNEAPRGADHNLQPFLEQLHLRLVRHTAVQGCHAGVTQFRGDGKVLTHLDGQFAGGYQNECLRGAGELQIIPAFVVSPGDALNRGQAKAQGFAGAGFCLGDNIVPGQRHRQRHCLNGEGGGDAHRRQCVANVLAYAVVGECLGFLLCCVISH